MSLEEEKLILPFSPVGHSSVIGWMLRNKEFALKCKHNLKPEMFANDMLGDIFTALCKHMVNYNDTPSAEALSSHFLTKADKKVSEEYRKKIFDCTGAAGLFQLNHLENQITDWLQVSIFKDAQIKSAKYYKQANIAELKSILKQCYEDIDKVKFTKTAQYDTSDPVGELNEMIKSRSDAITTGLPEFDNMIGGGLFPGEQTVIIAPTDIGKTTLCLNLLYHNIMNQKHCLFIIHEGSPTRIMMKLRQRFLEFTKDEYLNAAKNKDLVKLQAIKDMNENYIDEYLVYIPLIKAGGLFVEDTIEEIKRQMEVLKSKTGKYFALVVDDYPAKLALRHSRGLETRDKLSYIYAEFQRIAAEFACHVITPAQLNRTGYKENKERQPGEFQGLDNISEAFGICQNSDNVWVMNRSDVDAKNNQLWIVVDKTKEDEHKRKIMLKTDYARVITHDKRLGCLVQNQNALSVQVLSPNNLTK